MPRNERNPVNIRTQMPSRTPASLNAWGRPFQSFQITSYFDRYNYKRFFYNLWISFPNTPAPINEIKMFPNILTGDRVPSDDELDPETILSNLN